MFKLKLLKMLLKHGRRLMVYPLGFEPMNDILELGEPDTPSRLGLKPYEDVILVTKDELKINCYLNQKKDSKSYAEARGTVIIFHGNSSDRGDILHPYASHLQDHYNILAAEYRGYGLSEGTPTEKGGLCLDAQAAVDYVHSHPVLSTVPIIVLGHSLGGAVAIHVTSENSEKIDALILENTFTSMPAVVRDFPVLGWPLSIFCPEKWRSHSKIKHIPRDVPVLLLGGVADKLVRPHQMRTLWKAVKNRGQLKKTWHKFTIGSKEEIDPHVSQDQFILFPDGDHRTTHEQAGYWTVVQGFLDKVIEGTDPA